MKLMGKIFTAVFILMFMSNSAQSLIKKENASDGIKQESEDLTIRDIQYTEDPYGDSPYVGQEVTITGIVTSSAQVYDLGYIYIQDDGGGPWSGINITGQGLADFYRQEEVILTGTVEENFGMTTISVSSIDLTGKLKDIIVSDLDPSDSAAYIGNGWEKWESVLVRYKDPFDNKLFVSHPKTDPNDDFGDYAVSATNKKASKKLGLILAGRQSSTSQSSLYVSIVRDSAWTELNGKMQVPPIETSSSMVMDGVIGLLHYSFGSYRLLPRNNDDFININEEMAPTSLPGSPLSIMETDKPNFSVYPNPASNVINIVSHKEVISEIRMHNLQGQEFFHNKTISNQYQLDISGFKTGHYILQVKTKGDTFTSTHIVIQK